jgi:hypothetical protein
MAVVYVLEDSFGFLDAASDRCEFCLALKFSTVRTGITGRRKGPFALSFLLDLTSRPSPRTARPTIHPIMTYWACESSSSSGIYYTTLNIINYGQTAIKNDIYVLMGDC